MSNQSVFLRSLKACSTGALVRDEDCFACGTWGMHRECNPWASSTVLEAWFWACRLQQSMGLLGRLEDRIERIHSASEAAAQRQKDQDMQIEEAKNHLKSNMDFRNSVCHDIMQS